MRRGILFDNRRRRYNTLVAIAMAMGEYRQVHMAGFIMTRYSITPTGSRSGGATICTGSGDWNGPGFGCWKLTITSCTMNERWH